MGKKTVASATTTADYDLDVTGSFHGKIRDVDVGLVTGDVTQANVAVTASTNVAVASGDTTQATSAEALQLNGVLVSGDASLDIDINGTFKGQIRDIDVGLITGDVVQLNGSAQASTNASVGNSGPTTQAVSQAALQANVVEVSGTVDVSIVANGDFKGQIRNVEVGVVTGDVHQSNLASQTADNLAFSFAGTSSQSIQQVTLQENLLQAIGDVHVSIVFEGDFKGQFRDVTIGVVTADVIQSNSSVAVGVNLVDGGGGKAAQDISSFASHANWIDAEGDLNVEIRIADGFKGQIRDLDIGVMIDNVLAPSGDAVWN